MIIAIIIGIIAIFLIGYYGLPENIDPNQYQEDPPDDLIMPGAEPFFLKGESDVCFLLIHGFEGSPFTLREFGERIHSEGHTVIAPLLPGHGTNINEFSKTRFPHWYNKVKNTYFEYRPKYQKFFIIGFSMGGNIALQIASKFSVYLPVTAIITISAPVVLNGFVGGQFYLKDWRLLFTGIIKMLTPRIAKEKRRASIERVSRWVGYSKFYSTGPVHSLKLNIPKVRKGLKKIKAPIFCIHASNDITVNSDNLHLIFRKVNSTEKRAHMFRLGDELSTRHVLITHKESKERIYYSISKFVQDVLNGFESTTEKSSVRRYLKWFGLG